MPPLVATGTNATAYLLDPGPLPSTKAGDFRLLRSSGLTVERAASISTWTTLLQCESRLTPTAAAFNRALVDLRSLRAEVWVRGSTITVNGGQLDVWPEGAAAPAARISDRLEAGVHGVGSDPFGGTVFDAIHWERYAGALSGSGTLRVASTRVHILGVSLAFQNTTGGNVFDIVGFRRGPSPGNRFAIQIDWATDEFVVTYDNTRYPSGRTWRAIVFTADFSSP